MDLKNSSLITLSNFNIFFDHMLTLHKIENSQYIFPATLSKTLETLKWCIHLELSSPSHKMLHMTFVAKDT